MNIQLYHNIHKDQEVKGFLNYHYCSELEDIAQYNVYTVLEDNNIINLNYTGDDEIEYLCIYVHGSRVFGNPRKDSDIDFVLFYKGTIREDDLFNIFADESIYIEHVKCDFNPIQIDDDSDIEYYIQKHDVEYHQTPILEKKVNLALALDDFDDQDLISQQTETIKDTHYTKEYLDLMKEVVDLGLPSGTLWCKYNLEAFPELDSNPYAFDFYGNYYAWGETKVKNDYQYDTLTFCDGVHLTKYCEKDGLTQLLPEDDVAYIKQKCHNFKFHIPTKEQCEELLKYTDKQQITNFKFKGKPINGLNGVLFISKINGNELFFPAAGYMDVDHTKDKKISGGIWTSTNAFGQDDIINYYKTYFLHFDIDIDFSQPAYIDIDYRGRGLNIRSVINL